MFIDMPLNASPPTLDGRSFDAKLAAAQRNSLTDFAFWGGLGAHQSGSHGGACAARGVVGFKAFMSGSGIKDFPRSDEIALWKEGMGIAHAAGFCSSLCSCTEDEDDGG